MADLGDFLAGLTKREISGITSDSRKVKKNFIFVAIKGLTVDGHNFIPQAVTSGASIIIGEKEPKSLATSVKFFKVRDSRKTLSLVASWYYDYPSRKMKIIGVTGTDGKTTTAMLIYWILKVAGRKVGLVSTVSARIGNKEYDTGFHVTSPEPESLQKFLSLMVKEGTKYAVLEVTSHGLDQDRVYGIDFDIGVLTNITHEHLDYHRTFQKYVSAKAKLFDRSRLSVINCKYSSLIKPVGETIFYDENTLKGDIKESVQRRFPEIYNLFNSAAAITVARKLGIKDADTTLAINSFPGVPGRMEEVKNKKGIRIIIDFAHTPNALENVLTALRNEVPNGKRLISVFGCAGERDVTKRPMMGMISSKLANITVLTSEDPRREKVTDIIKQIAKGIKDKKAKVYKIPNREKAISFAINKIAVNGDIVVICGKGHEKSMNINGVETTWSDRKAVLKSI